MSAHTPGPWATDGLTVYRQKNVHPKIDSRICKVDSFHTGGGDREANASLISAAPELLAACKFVLECTSGGDFTMNGPNGLRTVSLGWFLKKIIAKAEGKT